ncbi:MAG: hypothetical protein R3B13_29605 [Polyangiaceae bacterium]
MNELSRDARSLIELAAGGDDPSAEDRRRVHGAVMTAVGAGAGMGALTAAAGAKALAASGAKALAASGNALGATAATAAAGSALTAAGPSAVAGGVKLLGWLALGGAVGLGVAVPLAATNERTTTMAPAASTDTRGTSTHAHGAAARAASTVARAPAASRSDVAPAAEDLGLEVPLPGPAGAARTTRASTPAGAARGGAESSGSVAPNGVAEAQRSDALTEESGLLARAQKRLVAGDPNAALRELDQHAARYPHGSLTPEREAARALALCAAGRVAEARAASARFVAQHPNSPLTPRVRAACGQ